MLTSRNIDFFPSMKLKVENENKHTQRYPRICPSFLPEDHDFAEVIRGIFSYTSSMTELIYKTQELKLNRSWDKIVV